MPAVRRRSREAAQSPPLESGHECAIPAAGLPAHTSRASGADICIPPHRGWPIVAFGQPASKTTQSKAEIAGHQWMSMPPGLPHHPPLAMKLWLAQRFGLVGKTSSAMPGHASGNTMSIEPLEHIVRNRVRRFLRHTWLVTILGTIILGAGVAAAIYLTTAPTVMRIAAGPADSANTKFVQVLT